MPINFICNVDLEKLAEQTLNNLNLKYQKDKSPLTQFLNWKKRYIRPQPRIFLESSKVHINSNLQKGYDNLRKAIKNGENINPYLSSNLNKAGYSDGFLNEFGLYHFHLGVGIAISGKSKGFINRTKEVALAKVTDEAVIIILIEDHDHKTNPNIWYDESCIQILHDEFPKYIAKFKIQGMTVVNPITSPEHRKALRSINVNAAVTLQDGTSYQALGGGITASGDSFTLLHESARLNRNMKALIESLRLPLIDSIGNRHTCGNLILDFYSENEVTTIFKITFNINQSGLVIINKQNKTFKIYLDEIYNFDIHPATFNKKSSGLYFNIPLTFKTSTSLVAMATYINAHHRGK